MLGLGIDTSGSSCAVALWDDDHLECAFSKSMSRGYAESLMPMVDHVLLDAGLTYKKIDVVGVATGPGSFTGLRVGLSAARGLSLGLSCALHGVTSFYAAALSAAREIGSDASIDLWVILSSRRSNFFLQKFKLRFGCLEAHGRPLSANENSILQNLAVSQPIITGDGAQQIRLTSELKKTVRIIPDCRKASVALIAELAVKKGADQVQAGLNALYINPPNVTLATKQMS